MAGMQIEVELETACSVLENEYRRRILRILEGSSGTMTRNELARTIADDTHLSESFQQIDLSLYHVHLPKLADENAIRYDTEAETVAITENGEQFLQWLDTIEAELQAGTS